MLLVDDNEDIGRVTEQVLQTLGCDVRRVTAASEAVALLEQGVTVDVVLSDIVMPGEITGLELRSWAHAHRPELPVVLMTGYSSAARDLSGDERLLRKPVAPKELSEALLRAAGGAVGRG